MHIRSEVLRGTYHRIKAAGVVERIKQVTKTPHDEGTQVDPPQEDNIAGVPASKENADETDPSMPTRHLLPEDPEFDTDNIVSGTGSGPSMESTRNYL
jgi:hypothetical protein